MLHSGHTFLSRQDYGTDRSKSVSLSHTEQSQEWPKGSGSQRCPDLGNISTTSYVCKGLCRCCPHPFPWQPGDVGKWYYVESPEPGGLYETGTTLRTPALTQVLSASITGQPRSPPAQVHVLSLHIQTQRNVQVQLEDDTRVSTWGVLYFDLMLDSPQPPLI